jgi:hypothetical protein
MKAADSTGPHATPKALRHRSGVNATVNSVPLNKVQKWLGHADLKTTSIYADATRAEEGRVRERMWAFMADIDITQAEADALIEMEKRFVDEKDWTFPGAGERMAMALTSTDKRENFMLDITRAQIKLTKATYQNRARSAIILMRLDLDGPPHRNPDGEEIPCPHLHKYREGFGDKWAIAAPRDRYANPADLFATCEAFMQHCNITGPSKMQKGLFS